MSPAGILFYSVSAAWRNCDAQQFPGGAGATGREPQEQGSSVLFPRSTGDSDDKSLASWDTHWSQETMGKLHSFYFCDL